MEFPDIVLKESGSTLSSDYSISEGEISFF